MATRLHTVHSEFLKERDIGIITYRKEGIFFSGYAATP